jgi:hypothetical protein
MNAAEGRSAKREAEDCGSLSSVCVRADFDAD